MQRKKFIASLLPALTLPGVLPLPHTPAPADDKTPKLPPYLVHGDLVAIVCTSGYIEPAAIQPAVERLKAWGFKVLVGETIGKKTHSLGGTDLERAADLQRMLDDRQVKAILCARGGYGAVRIVDQLNFSVFNQFPKWIIGFSDLTVLHAHLNRRYGIASLHSKMCNSFPENWPAADELQKATIESIRDCITGAPMQYTFPYNSRNRPGRATGQLVGGNLKTLESLACTPSDLITKNKILFVEDTGEYLYSIDRMFWNLRRTGKLSHLSGLIVGGFRVKKEENEADEFGLSLEEIVLEKVREYDYPVGFDFPVGHQKNNFALKCGVQHRLEVAQNGSLLQEINA